MTLASFRPRAGLRAALCFYLFLAVSRSQIGAEPVPLNKPAEFPDWWFRRSVIPRQNQAIQTPAWPADYRQADDYTALNQGQLKHLATAAYDELPSLPGGAGPALTLLVGGWYNPVNGQLPPAGSRVAKSGVASAHLPVNLGQLKAVAQPFYDRLIAEQLCPGYPWSYSSQPADNAAVANIGQAKNLFQFVVGSSSSSGSAGAVNEYGLPAWFEAAVGSPDAVERARGTNPGGQFDPNGTTGWPLSPNLNVPPVPLTRFAVLPLNIPANAFVTKTLGNGCQVLYQTVSGYKNFVWTPEGTHEVLLNACIA